MRAAHPWRRRAAAIASAAALATMFAAGALLAAAPAHAGDELPADAHVVRDLHYGEVLFHVFQDQWFEGITSIGLAQQAGRLPHHGDEAEVLRGGLLLSYGLHYQAGAIFTELIARGAPPPVRDRAWYYLARIRWQRGVPGEAALALGHIETPLPAPLEEDRQLLQAQVLLATGDPAGAVRVLQALQPAPGVLARLFDAAPTDNLYARYNLGVALIRSGQAAAGNTLLAELGQRQASDDEARALRDRANLALGFAALQAGDAAAARTHLERVRLNGPQSNQALLGFGWAAAALKKPREALVPWTELLSRDADDAAVLEARIALPWAYAELGAAAQALTRYEEAVAAYAQQSHALDESIAALRTGRLVDGLVAANPQPGPGWLRPSLPLPPADALPHPRHLLPVLASHAFQEGWKNYTDLLALERHLADWQQRTGVYDSMLATRQDAFAQRLPQVRQGAAGLGLPALHARDTQLDAALQQARTDADGVAYADPAQQAQRARIARAQALLAAHPEGSDPQLDEARARLQRVVGALTWQLAEGLPQRQWAATRDLKTADAALAEADRHDAALARAQVEEPQRLAAFQARLQALGARLAQLQPRAAQLRELQRAQLQAQAIEVLQQQKDRLASYTLQARLALAQLHDQPAKTDAAPAAKEPHATTPQ